MTDNVPGDVIAVPTESDAPLSPMQAARELAKFRNEPEKPKQEEAPPEAAAPEETPPQEEPAAPAEEATSETTTEAQEPAEPTIEAPRSWPKDWKEDFKSYPHDLQQKIAAREQDRETALRRGQNDLAEQRKSFEQKLQEADKLKVEYEQALPALLQTLHQQQQGEFSDIKTMSDVEKLAREDWPRYALWDAQQKKIAAVQQELKQTDERRQSEYQARWTEFATKEDAAFLDKVPEMADSPTAKKYSDMGLSYLKDIGFSDQDLVKLWNGQTSLSLRDHRQQQIILDAARYREAKKQVPVKAAKPVPPVQKPGAALAKASQAETDLKQLDNKLSKSGDLRDAVAFITARRSAR